MHVTRGTDPKYVDTNVRFRTTYYFRVFDFCWSADTAVGSGSGAPRYRSIIPQTDTLYRYRMTGKASALGSNIKFESGVLNEKDIDPFGADVVYNGDVNRYVVRSRSDAKSQADQIAADRRAAALATAARSAADAALGRFEALGKLLEQSAKLPEKERDIAQAELKTAMADVLQDYTGKLRAPLGDALTDRFDRIDKLLAGLAATEGRPTTPPAAATAEAIAKAAVEEARAAINEAARKQALSAQADGAATPPLCPANTILTKGFQVMGPEGMRPFDQKQRLVMAMYTSAKPLTETLTEYSGRIVNGRANPAEQLLPLARETLRIVETQRTLDAAAGRIAAGGDAVPKLDELFATTIETFGTAPR
ncbi:hypothetical protein [Sphingomonas sp. Leaf62]|uniref:hypothetical protein n=1 Tax=Sphingomonas sp. Leaf62 TaxID=1736228 RepID=UPI001F229534|nr:hypothetical protein [Sphingomonas sp. Leaf62]